MALVVVQRAKLQAEPLKPALVVQRVKLQAEPVKPALVVQRVKLQAEPVRPALVVQRVKLQAEPVKATTALTPRGPPKKCPVPGFKQNTNLVYHVHTQ